MLQAHRQPSVHLKSAESLGTALTLAAPVRSDKPPVLLAEQADEYRGVTAKRGMQSGPGCHSGLGASEQRGIPSPRGQDHPQHLPEERPDVRGKLLCRLLQEVYISLPFFAAGGSGFRVLLGCQTDHGLMPPLASTASRRFATRSHCLVPCQRPVNASSSRCHFGQPSPLRLTGRLFDASTTSRSSYRVEC